MPASLQATRPLTQTRERTVVGRDPTGRPQTYRLAPPRSRDAAYRRLIISILGLDVASLAQNLHRGRRSVLGSDSVGTSPLARAA
jgi:hypothetical protein